LNKSDRPERIRQGFAGSVVVSCRTGAGIERLRRLVGRRLVPDSGLALAAGERQLEALRGCRAALARCRTAPSTETAALEIRHAIDMLGQIDIRLPTAAILDRVFARFCVGK
jgi:tRNA modification GTPase